MVNILLIDADADSALRNSQSLERAGFHVDVAAPGLGCEDFAPDLVVLSVLRLERPMMRLVSKGRQVPHIAISSEERDAIRGEDFGCAAVLVRPVMYDQLVIAVRRVVKGVTSSTSASAELQPGDGLLPPYFILHSEPVASILEPSD